MDSAQSNPTLRETITPTEKLRHVQYDNAKTGFAHAKPVFALSSIISEQLLGILTCINK